MASLIARALTETKNAKAKPIEDPLQLFHKHFVIGYGGTVTVDAHGVVSAEGTAVYGNKQRKISQLPFKFGTVSNEFLPIGMGLESFTGFPQTVQGCWCDKNKFSNLIGSPTVAKFLSCRNNPFLSLEGLSPNVERFTLTWTPHLPLLRLVALESAFLTENKQGSLESIQVEEILRRHGGTDPATLRKRLTACQKELIDAGFAGNAKW
jgi:hypothetical protein